MSSLIEIDRAWKKFPRTHAARRRYAMEMFARRLRPSGRKVELKANEHWALRDIGVEVKRGEAVGVLGSNGAGKSTLLSLIAGIHAPDRGSVRVGGRVSSFINLSAGLKGNMTGIENIFMKGALEGRSRQEVESSLDAIVDFSGLGDRVCDPVGTYSSGMKMRLAFSVAVHSRPDILLVDEVMAVGDFEFKQKCLHRVQQMKDDCAFILVSHSMPQIARFCDTAMYLERGQLRYLGDVDEAIRLYQRAESGEAAASSSTSHVEQQYLNEEDIEILEMGLKTDIGEGRMSTNGSLAVTGRFRLKKAAHDFRIGLPIRTPRGEVMTAVSSEQSNPHRISVAAGKEVSFRVHFPSLPLNPGRYLVIVAVHDGPRFLLRQIIGEIDVETEIALTWGTFTPQACWRIAQS